MNQFLHHVIPVVLLDTAHLNSQWHGTLYAASLNTGNKNNIPLAFTIMADNENTRQGWEWILTHLNEALPALAMKSKSNSAIKKSNHLFVTVIKDM
jgi:hypothetical protein